MLSGIKFVPREQLLQADSGSDEEREDLSSSKKGKYGKRSKKSRFARSGEEEEEEELEKEQRRAERRKKKRSRRRHSSGEDSPTPSASESESESGHEEERGSKRRRRRRRRRESLSEDSNLSDRCEKEKGRKRKHGKEKREKRDKGKNVVNEDSSDEDYGERDVIPQTNELARKELGLEWMLKSGSRTENTGARKEKEMELEEPKVEEVKKANPRELNPYLKYNGSGYPDDASLSGAGDKLLSSSVVGDGGASWRLKALKRAKEQAACEGRKLEEVVEERWGSLGHLAASVAASGAAPAHAHLRAIKHRKRGQTENSEVIGSVDMEGGVGEAHGGSRAYLRDISSRHPEMRKPRRDSLPWKRNKGQNLSTEDKSLISAAVSGLNKYANDGSFIDHISRLQSKGGDFSNSCNASTEANDHRENEVDFQKDRSSIEISSANKPVLTKNQLAAKVLQLRMKGKHEEAEKLSKEMEAMVKKEGGGTKMIEQGSEGSMSRHTGRQTYGERRSREEDADLHLAKKIMQNKQYSLSGRADDEYDFDDGAPSKKRNRRKEQFPEEKGIVGRRLLTQQERCQFCFENPSRPKHLVVSIGNFTYLMLPQSQPLVQGHCCILPMQHEAATRKIDKNVWEEIRNFKKCLLKMFARQEKDVVFLETVIGLAKQRRHCLIECIPIPYDVATEAPLYFKKAIDEAEDEWGQHEAKKLIPTSGNLRQVIPENFAYFHVEFGLDRGFVHVIDDDSNFSSGFGLNVIRGLLRLPEEDMYRRRRQEPMDKQKQAVASFAREWEPFDWTKALD